ncbi:MAG: RluA family pseudouridine synthase [Rubripirellula sp.]
MQTLDVLYEDNHLLVINKPVGIATMGAESGPTIHSLAVDYIRKKYGKPGKVFLGVVHRLDAMTTGVLVLARTSKSASRLSAQFAAKQSKGGPRKIYLAGVEGALDQSEGEWVDHIRKDDAAMRMRVVDDAASGAQEASLRFKTLSSQADASVVAIQLLTGRKHQIRVQFAEHGYKLIGDRKYGSTRKFGSQPQSIGIALHAWRLQVVHPTKKENMWFEAPFPASWKTLAKTLPSSERIRATINRSFELDDDSD